MKIKAVKNINECKEVDFLVLPFIEEKEKAVALFDNTKFKKEYSIVISSKDFIGKEKEISLVYTNSKKYRRILLLGLGKSDQINEEKISNVYSFLMTFLKNKKAKKVGIFIPKELNISQDDLVFKITETLYLSNYSFNKFKHCLKKVESTPIQESFLIGIDSKENSIINKAIKISEGVCLTRDLVNNNADDETPETLANISKALENISNDIKVTVFDKKAIEKEKMGLLLAVNKGSDKEPRFIIIEYKGDKSNTDSTAIVGKGITYDTGGLSLKPSTSMDTMKSDMAGASAVIGIIHVIASLKLKINVFGVIASTENSIGPSSYKPGDVYISMSKKSVEVKNTDAEGRLILADALTYVAEKIKPKRVIDLATLTGAIVVALGEDISAVYSTSDQLAEMLLSSAQKVGDHLWRMPLFKNYKKHLESDIADLKNIGNGREAGSITAALFLQEFIDEKTDWAHLDIAGPAFIAKASDISPTHATGYGVRLLANFLERISKNE